jgi:hypothetical protein
MDDKEAITLIEDRMERRITLLNEMFEKRKTLQDIIDKGSDSEKTLSLIKTDLLKLKDRIDKVEGEIVALYMQWKDIKGG